MKNSLKNIGFNSKTKQGELSPLLDTLESKDKSYSTDVIS
jgi:hypothetical protein